MEKENQNKTWVFHSLTYSLAMLNHLSSMLWLLSCFHRSWFGIERSIDLPHTHIITIRREMKTTQHTLRVKMINDDVLFLLLSIRTPRFISLLLIEEQTKDRSYDIFIESILFSEFLFFRFSW